MLTLDVANLSIARLHKPNRFVPVAQAHASGGFAGSAYTLRLAAKVLPPPLPTSTHLPDHHMHASARACAAQPAPTPSERCLAVLACSTHRARPPPLPQSGAFRLPVSALCSVLSCNRRCEVHACPRVSTATAGRTGWTRRCRSVCICGECARLWCAIGIKRLRPRPMGAKHSATLNAERRKMHREVGSKSCGWQWRTGLRACCFGSQRCRARSAC
jgi:hypothetical protein